jgi:hypothetical protein
MSDHLLIPRELVSRIRQHLAELRELNADLTWTDVSEVAELDALKPAQPLVEALEDIAVDDGVDETSAKIAREALAAYRGER